ncbi:MAG: hypothetical protein PHI02_09480, partial [Sulfurovaceae bacterium]|nr:hypothetical protein [Sulfurovaceae bacterium]
MHKINKLKAYKPFDSLNMKKGLYDVESITWYPELFQEKYSGEVFYKGYRNSDFIEEIELFQSAGWNTKDEAGNDIEVYYDSTLLKAKLTGELYYLTKNDIDLPIIIHANSKKNNGLLYDT